MAGGGDKVEHGVDSIIPEAGVTLDARLLGQDVIVLPLEVADNFRKAARYISEGNQLDVWCIA